jgi:hypothetical protein
MSQLNIDKPSMPLSNHSTQIDSYHELIRQSRELNKQGNTTEAIATCKESLKRISFDDLSLRMLIHSTIGDLLTAQNKLHEAIASFQTSANLARKEKGYNNNFNSHQLKANQGPDFFIIGGMKCGTSSPHKNPDKTGGGFLLARIVIYWDRRTNRPKLIQKY